MDRFDDLLIKARAEMIGKTPTRKVITKDSAFNAAWDLVKGYEDQMRALQEKRNKPGFFGRMKQGYQSTRNSPSQQNEAVPLPTRSNEMRATTQDTGNGGFTDFMGQQGGLETPSPARTSRVSGSPPGFTDFMGQQGGLETPQALEPQEVPMRDEDINTEQPPAPARAPGPTGPPPNKTTAVQGEPPSMASLHKPYPGESPSVRAKIRGRGPSDQNLYNALTGFGMDPSEAMTRVGAKEKRTVGRQRAEPNRPLDAADIPMVSEQQEADPRTKGQLGDRRDSARDEEYKRIEQQRNRISDRRVKRINRGDMTSSQAIEELKRIRQAGKYPDLPTVEEQTEPSLDEANRALGGGTLSPNQKREAVDTPIPKRQMAEPATTALEPRNLPMVRQQGGVPAVRDEPPATEALPPSQLPMRRPAGALPERTDAQAPPRGSRRNQRSPLAVREDRPDPKEIQLPSKERRAERNRRNTAADEVEAQRTPAPQPEPQVEEQSEPVEKPKPKVKEQTTKKPPQGKQATLFGREEQPKDDKATVEAAQKRKANRAGNRETTQALPRIGADTDSEAITALMDRAEEGDEAARKHLYNAMGDLEDHHPSQAERYNELFGKMPQEANLSLLPSGMRQSILKDNDTDVNYSLLPNGWA